MKMVGLEGGRRKMISGARILNKNLNFLYMNLLVNPHFGVIKHIIQKHTFLDRKCKTN